MRKRAKPHKWTDDQVKFVKDNIKGTPYKKMWKMVNEKFGLNLTYRQIEGFLKRNNITNGNDTRFKKGERAWNKGMKGLSIGGKETWFKKGNKPDNYRPVGSERTCPKNGYTVVKVQDEGRYQDRWKHKHVVLWEKVNGKVPDDHVIIFLDGNNGNMNMENLEMISRSELAIMNNEGLITSDPELTKTGLMLVRLNQKTDLLKHFGTDDKKKIANYIKAAARNGLNENTFMARLKRGWTLHDAINKPLNYRPKKS